MKGDIKGSIAVSGYYALTIFSIVLILSLMFTTSIAVSEQVVLPVSGEQKFEAARPGIFALAGLPEREIRLASLDSLYLDAGKMQISMPPVNTVKVGGGISMPFDNEIEASLNALEQGEIAVDVSGLNLSAAENAASPLSALSMNDVIVPVNDPSQCSPSGGDKIPADFPAPGSGIGISSTTTRDCHGPVSTGGCTGSDCYGYYSVACSYCSSINPSLSHLSACSPSSCPSGYYDMGVECYPNACNGCSGSSCNYDCSYQQLYCERMCTTNPCTDPDYPNYCGGYCWSSCSSIGQYGGKCCHDEWWCCSSSSYPQLCCPDSGNPFYCTTNSDTCLSNGCSLDYPYKCNSQCWSCSSGSYLCCPSSGDPLYCCPDGSVCQSDGTCCWHECSSGEKRCNGNYKQTCGNYDSDSCLEWGGDVYCTYGCSGGECVTSTTIYGYLKDEDNNPLSGITMKLTDCNDNDVASDVTDSSGYFSISANAGDYKLKILMPFGTLQLSQDGNSCLTFGGDLNLGTLNIRTRFTLSGVIEDEYGNAVQGATAQLTDCSDNLIASDTSASDGSFTVEALYGEYKLKIVYGSATYTVSFGGEECNYYVPGDYQLSSPLGIYVDTHLAGTVEDEAGNPLGGLTVKFNDCDGNFVASDTTDSSGGFQLTATPGDYMLLVVYNSNEYVVWLGGEECNYYPAGNWQLPGPVVMTTKTHLSGVIEDEYGNGRQGLTVQFTDCSDVVVTSGVTDSDGSFELVANPDTYKVKIVTDFGPLLLLIDEEECNYYPSGHMAFGQPIIISVHTHIHGYATELNGNPIEDMTVELYECSGSFVTSDVTDSSGYFSLSADSGKYELKVVIGGERYLLEDSAGNSCFIFMGDVSLDLSMGVDCSEYDYECYYGNWKLFGCHFDPNEPACSCYYEVCNYGCTPGLPECDVPTGTIHVDVDGVGDKPLPLAKVFIDNYYAGVTDSLGKRTAPAEYGYRNVKVNCPDDAYCDDRDIYVDGTEYAYFDCVCGTDSDGDGLSDSDELLIGTNPNDASEDLWFVFTDMRISKICFDPSPLFSGSIGIEERSRLMETLGGLDPEFIAAAQHDEEKVLDILSMSGVSADKLVENPTGAAEMLQKSSFADGVETGGAVVLVMTDEYGVTSVFYFGAACTGQIAGEVEGAIGGVVDDVNLVVTIIKGLWYYVTHIKEITGIWDDVKTFFANIPSIFGHIDDIFHEVSINIFTKAAEVNFWKGDRQDYLSFQASFYSGYVIGYVAEQVLALKGIGAALDALKVGAKVGQVSARAVEILTKITREVSGTAADILRRAKIWSRAVDWSEDAITGAAKISDHAGDVKKLNLLFKRVEEISGGLGDAERLSKNIEKISQESSALAEKATNNILEKAAAGNVDNVVGTVAEAEVAAKHADDLLDLAFKPKADLTDFDVVLKNGDVIEVKYRNWDNWERYFGDIKDKIRNFEVLKEAVNSGDIPYKTKIGKLKFAFKSEPPADVKNLLSENGISWELI
jgi:hypothetical protein